jgi:hypothetical protein
MDLSKFSDLDTPVDVIIKDPTTGKETDMVVTAYRYTSKANRDLQLKLARNRKEGDEPMSDAEFQAQLVTGWKNVEEGGKAVEFSTEAAKEIFEKYSFVAFQVHIKMLEGGFSPKG